MTVNWYPEIDSTNSEALRHLPELPHGTVLAALTQTAGRGQRGNSWFSAPGQNLTFSIVLKPSGLPATEAVWLNILSAVAVARFLDSLDIPCSIKWPNDIYAGRRKICGMLIENSFSAGCVGSSVIGIGINLNQTDFPQLASATSLRLQSGKTYDLEESLDRFLSIFEQLQPLAFEENGRAELFGQYSSRLFQKGTPARYHDYLCEQEYSGILRDVLPDGRLWIDAPDGPRYYRFKEVGFIL